MKTMNKFSKQLVEDLSDIINDEYIGKPNMTGYLEFCATIKPGMLLVECNTGWLEKRAKFIKQILRTLLLWKIQVMI